MEKERLKEVVKGYAELEERLQDYVCAYINETGTPDYDLFQASVRVSHGKNLVLCINLIDQVIPGSKELVCAVRGIELPISYKKQKLPPVDVAALIRDLQEICSTEEFLNSLYPGAKVFSGMRILPAPETQMMNCKPVLIPDNKEVSKVKEISLLFGWQTTAGDLAERIRQTDFVMEFAPERKEHIMEQVRLAYKELKKQIQKIQKWRPKEEEHWKFVLSEQEYKNLTAILDTEPDQEPFKIKDRDTVLIQYQGVPFRYDRTSDKAVVEWFFENTLLHLNLIHEKRAILDSFLTKWNADTTKKSVSFSYGTQKNPALCFQIKVKLSDKQQQTVAKRELTTAHIRTAFNEVKNILKEKEKEEAQKAKQKIKTLKEQGLYGSILADDIIKLVQKNESHITESVVIKILKGLSMESSSPYYYNYDYLGMYGKYAGIDEKEIQQCMYKLQKKNYLCLKRVSGFYGHYNVVKLGANDFPSFPAHDPAATSMEQWTDHEWEIYLNKYQKEPPETVDWMGLVLVLEHPAVLCACRNQLAAIFSNAPESVRLYLKTMAKLEPTAWKKKLYNKLERGEAD